MVIRYVQMHGGLRLTMMIANPIYPHCIYLKPETVRVNIVICQKLLAFTFWYILSPKLVECTPACTLNYILSLILSNF